MKKLLTLFLIVFVQQTLFSGDTGIGGYAGPEVKFTKIMDGDIGILLGGRGALVVDKQLGIGLGGWYLVHHNKFTHDNLPLNRDFRMEFGYGGLYFEYLHTDELILYNVNCLFGAGAAHLNSLPDYGQFGTESFGIIEPGIQLEMNFFPWMKVALGGSYRFLYEYSDFYGYEKSDFEGLSGVLTFKFGGNF